MAAELRDNVTCKQLLASPAEGTICSMFRYNGWLQEPVILVAQLTFSHFISYDNYSCSNSVNILVLRSSVLNAAQDSQRVS